MPTRYETIEIVPQRVDDERLATMGDLAADHLVGAIDAREIRISNPGKEGPTGSSRLDCLLELDERDEREGLGAAPSSPHFPEASGEPRRVQPSRRKK